MTRKDPKELLQRLDRAREMVQVHTLYRHRGNGLLYKVDAITLREEDLAPAVDYHAVEEPGITWNRKVDIFMERFYRVEFALPPSDVTQG